MKTSFVRPAFFGVLATLAAFAAGCAGPQVKSPVGVSATQYEYVDVHGSKIPVLVPKGSGLQPLHTTSPATIIKGEDNIQRALGPGRIPLK